MLVILGIFLLVAAVGALWWALAPEAASEPAALAGAVVGAGNGGSVGVVAGGTVAAGSPAAAANAPDLHRAMLEMKAVQRLVRPAIEALGQHLNRITPVGFVEGWEHKIALAGLQGRWNVSSVLAGKALTLTGGVAAAGFVYLNVGGKKGIAMAALLLWVGWSLIDTIVSKRIEGRQNDIAHKLPDVLDQMSVCVEAGLGFDAALQRASASAGGALAEEFGRTLQDIRLGASRSEAMRALLDRSDVAELRMFTRALIQAEKTGVPIAKVLRTQSEDAREKRRQRAEEKAMKLPVKLIFPLLMFILPSLFIVILGPAILRVIQSGAFGG